MIIKEGYERLFGPIMYKYIFKLNQYIDYLDDGNTVFLYATRAGVRIKSLYESFLGNQLNEEKHKLFLTSRFLISKSYLSSHKRDVEQVLLDGYRYQNINDFIKGILRKDSTITCERYTDEFYESINAEEFIENFDINIHTDLYNYLDSEHQKYDEYFTDLIKGKSRVVIIDSGWSGTIQRTLMNIYPDIDFFGLYFGKIITNNPDWKSLQKMKGLMFEMNITESFNKVNDLNLETSFNVHRHLIEDLLEPSFDTVEYIEASNPDISVYIDDIDDSFKGVLEYFNKQSKYEKSILNIYKASDEALRVLKPMILYPKADAIELLGKMERSHDFGKEGSTSVLIQPKNRFHGDSKKKRIKDAIWSQGQIFLENRYVEEKLVEKLQANNLELVTFALPKEPIDYTNVGTAIITRTMDREVLLRRAKDSVESQIYNDYMWVIINDSGDINPVLKIANESFIDPCRIKVINNFFNIGMEAASNRAIGEINSKYIIIHDDDDSWDKSFLEKTVSFLESNVGKKYDAVITDTIYVSESIYGNEIVIHEKKPYNDWVSNVHITEMAQGNFFAPICFLFKRKIYDKIGGFDEKLPVLGDWDFNLKYLMHADIGVIKEPLAYYYHRDRPDANTSSTYSNSVIGGMSKHMEYAAIVKNKFIRNNPDVLSGIISNGYVHQDIRSMFSNSSSTIHNYKSEVNNKLELLMREFQKEMKDEVVKSVGWLRNEIVDMIEGRK